MKRWRILLTLLLFSFREIVEDLEEPIDKKYLDELIAECE